MTSLIRPKPVHVKHGHLIARPQIHGPNVGGMPGLDVVIVAFVHKLEGPDDSVSFEPNFVAGTVAVFLESLFRFI